MRVLQAVVTRFVSDHVVSFSVCQFHFSGIPVSEFLYLNPVLFLF